MINRLLSIVLIVSSIWLVVGFIRPQFGELDQTTLSIEERRQTLLDAERVIERRDRIMTEYASISDEEVQRMRVILPDVIDPVRLALDLSVLSKAYDLEMTDIDVSGVETAMSATNEPQQVVMYAEDGSVIGQGFDYSSVPLFVTASVKASFVGSYDSFIAFLLDLEKSLKLMDIESLEVSADTSASSSDNDSEYTYQFATSLRLYRFVGRSE